MEVYENNYEVCEKSKRILRNRISMCGQNNEMTIPACDLMAAGAMYATTSNAYRNFYSDNQKAQYQTQKRPILSEQSQVDSEQFAQPGNDIDKDQGITITLCF